MFMNFIEFSCMIFGSKMSQYPPSIYAIRCAIWYQSLFGVCMVVQTHANAFFYLHVVSIRLHQLAWHSNGSVKRINGSNIRMPFKQVKTSNLMTFEWYFLISQYHENCNPMSSFTLWRHVP